MRAIARERDQIDVGRIQQQLNSHQDVDCVLACEHTKNAKRKERGTEEQIVLKGNHTSLLRRTSIAAPIKATSKRIEAISKGSKYSCMKSLPIASVVGSTRLSVTMFQRVCVATNAKEVNTANAMSMPGIS